MLKNKRFIAAILIALGIVIVFDVRYFMNRPGRKPAVAGAIIIEPAHQAVPMAQGAHQKPTVVRTVDTRSGAEYVALWNRLYPLENHARNPFSTTRTRIEGKSGGHSTEKTLKEGGDPLLGAIAVINGKPLAIINGEPVTEEDTLGDIHVLNIDGDRVTLSRGGTPWHESLNTLPGNAAVYRNTAPRNTSP